MPQGFSKMINKGVIILVLLQFFVWAGMGQIEIISVITTSGNQNFGSGNQQYGSGNGAPSSPCPNVFQYQYSRNGWIGKIAVPPSSALGSNGRLVPVKLNLQMTLPATLPSKYVGRLFLAENDRVVWQKLNNPNANYPIVYNVIFPLSSPLPHVTSISVNRNLLCSGTGGRIPGRRFTIINLDHMFQPYTIGGGGGGPVVVAQPEKENEDDKYVVYEVVTSGSGGIAGISEVHPFIHTSTSRPTTVKTTTTTSMTTHFHPSTTERVHVHHTTPATVKPVTEVSKPSNVQDSCGRPLSSTHLIAFGETVSKRGDWPWVVAVFHNKVEEAGIRFACGGTIISRQFVLTAAHCAVRLGERMVPDLLTVHLGKFNLSNWFETGVQIRAVRYIHWHPDYNSLPDADLAVLELSVPAEFSSFVRPACIWPPEKADLALVVGRIGLVVGWGKDENNKILTTTPKLARSPIVSQEDCLRSHNGYSSLTSSRTFCAGFRNGTGPCSGDSGGGFMMSIPDEEHGGFKWYLRGVVSTSLETNEQVKCDLSQYVVFADVAKQKAWISQFIAL